MTTEEMLGYQVSARDRIIDALKAELLRLRDNACEEDVESIDRVLKECE
jgi:hypothetical protein